ncbi:MAG: alpha/beta hydrolase [Thermoplasmata archaeon]|nr:alpha/beta hydrolase [Thermoplasmata archaeon]
MLIFVHGMWCDGSVWGRYIKYFEERGFKCVAPDLNEGLDMKRARFEDYVRKIEGMVGENDVIIGHSLGGLVIQKVAERRKIKGGIAICPASPKGIKFKSSLILHSIKFLPKIVLRKPFKADIQFVEKMLANCVEEDKIEKIVSELKFFPPMPAYEVSMNKIEVDERKITSPLLFIATSHDKASPPEMVERIARKYGAEFVLKKGCHWIFDNDEIMEEISRFLIKIYS